MDGFAGLDYTQQIERLTGTARQALSAYGLADARLELVADVNNAVFRVTDGDASYALRLQRPGTKPAVWIQSEVAWLEALRSGGLPVPRPVRTRAGEAAAQVQVEGGAQPLSAVMLCWIEGTFYQNEAIPLDCVRQAGELLARLHDFAAGFRPQADFIRPRLDWGGLFGENSPYHPGDGAAIFTAEQRIIFAEVEARVRLVMDEIGQTPDQFGLIHGDFIAKNWLFNDAGAAALDFDDCAWGYSLYDLAPALLQFKVEARYAALRAALLEGYSVLRPLDEADLARLEALIAARHLASCRWLAGHLHHPRIRERAAALIAARSAELARFLQTGFLDEHGRKEFF